MKKRVLSVFALVLAMTLGALAQAVDYYYGIQTGYSNDPYASQIAMDSFNYSVKKRLDSVRVGQFDRGFASAPILRSDEAYAMAPSSRTSSVAGTYSRRQLDCVYYSGFTVWGDFYQTWASQSSKGGNPGYKYRASAPAIGFDWSSSNFTVGLATTYNWGKLKSKGINHDQKVRTWAVDAYVQYNTERFYGNLTLGYGYNRYKGTRHDNNTPPLVGYPENLGHQSKYHSNAFNIDTEFGMKFNFGGFLVTPHIGLRYFHDRRGVIKETNGFYDDTYDVWSGRKNYHVLELPVGVNLGYAFNAGGAMIIPQLRAAWIPELARRRGGASGGYYAYGNIGGGGDGFYPVDLNENSAKRSRHGFLLGLGIEAKITRSISAHLDYNVNFRSNAYEHHWNLGVGFTF